MIFTLASLRWWSRSFTIAAASILDCFNIVKGQCWDRYYFSQIPSIWDLEWSTNRSKILIPLFLLLQILQFGCCWISFSNIFPQIQTCARYSIDISFFWYWYLFLLVVSVLYPVPLILSCRGDQVFFHKAKKIEGLNSDLQWAPIIVRSPLRKQQLEFPEIREGKWFRTWPLLFVATHVRACSHLSDSNPAVK